MRTTLTLKQSGAVASAVDYIAAEMRDVRTLGGRFLVIDFTGAERHELVFDHIADMATGERVSFFSLDEPAREAIERYCLAYARQYARTPAAEATPC